MPETAPRRRIPIEPGFFTIPDDPGAPPLLLGSRCRACGEHFFPRRVVCARCLAQESEDVLLGPHGTLYTWTYVHFPLFAAIGVFLDLVGWEGAAVLAATQILVMLEFRIRQERHDVVPGVVERGHRALDELNALR